MRLLLIAISCTAMGRNGLTVLMLVMIDADIWFANKLSGCIKPVRNGKF